MINDNTILEEIITHFIEHHHFTRLAFLAGPKGHIDSERRIDCFRRVMKKHGLHVGNDSIFYGDFWIKMGKEAADFFFAPGKEIPQAIVCANDYMALTLCDEIIDRGYRIPEDICISGTDDVTNAVLYYPTLTTAGMPFEKMGETAVSILDKVLHGIPVEQYTYLDTYTVYRESCGCSTNPMNYNATSRYFMDKVHRLRSSYRANSAMSNVLNGVSTLDEVLSKLAFYVYANTDFDNFYMCLCSDWIDVNRSHGLSEDVTLAYHISNEASGLCYTGTFPRGDLLPDGIAPSKPTIFFANILHHHENIFGYVLLTFSKIMTYKTSYEGWLINLGNALENVRTTTQMNRLVSELARTYTVDMLTGLYNRRGLEVLSQELLNAPHGSGDQLMIFCADMDDLKAVNDNYGHTSGDVAINAISDALRDASVDDYICARCGGDEFTVIGILKTDSDPGEYAKRVNDLVDKFNKESNLPWLLHVSYGWHVEPVDELDGIEEGMKQADSQLYKEKAMSKARRLIENLESHRA